MPAPLPAFRVVRHCVPRGPDGLSPLQERMLADPSPVRICSAPTGAGKSYAFQRAVVRDGARVLFVVPTRRLAQNLARALMEDPERIPEETARRAVVWTSDERARLKAEHPELNVGRLRFRQMRGLDLPEGGCLIVATPESVAWLLLGPSFRPRGAPTLDLTDLARFDHVVFDEFHTIDARGLGLAAAVSRVVADVPDSARVTFLSATPIDIAPSLTAFGVPPEAMRVATEQVVTGEETATGDARALHGDVAYRFIDSPTMLCALQANESSIRVCLHRGLQVVVVFDSLADLNREKQDIAEWCEAIGVPRRERLALNSIDDSVVTADDALFEIGRQRDPLAYKVLLATSTVETGVTFRAGLMVMDPGHDAASFVQRAGRVARGDLPGEVVVRVTDRNVARAPWLREMMREFPTDGSRIDVGRFMHVALASDRKQFRCADGALTDAPPETFRSMPQRAVWCAAVFWAALEKAGHVRLGQQRSLRRFTPGKARYVLARLREIEATGLESAGAWRDAFLREALHFRIILPRVAVRDATGQCRSVPWNIYVSHSDLRSAPAVVGADGNIEVRLDRRLDEMVRTSPTEGWTLSVEALFPHERRRAPLDWKRQKEAWLREAERTLRSPLRAAQKKALEAACSLVRLSGIVPLVDTDDSAGTAGKTVIV